jgi:hypothetical protein
MAGLYHGLNARRHHRSPGNPRDHGCGVRSPAVRAASSHREFLEGGPPVPWVSQRPTCRVSLQSHMSDAAVDDRCVRTQWCGDEAARAMPTHVTCARVAMPCTHYRRCGLPHPVRVPRQRQGQRGLRASAPGRPAHQPDVIVQGVAQKSNQRLLLDRSTDRIIVAM